MILENIVLGNEHDSDGELSDIIGIAPLLKPSVLGEISPRFAKQGIDISSAVAFAEYLNDTCIINLLENITSDEIDEELLGKFLPFLDTESKYSVFAKILNGGDHLALHKGISSLCGRYDKSDRVSGP